MKSIIALFILITFAVDAQPTLTTATENSSSNKIITEDKDFAFLFTNAINFDFSSTSKTSLGYFGHISYFFNIKRDEKASNYYVNTGLLKVNYYNESLNKNIFTRVDNVLDNPLSDRTIPGTKYNKEFNKYDIDVKVNSYSAYFQVMRKITKKYNDLYVHLHAELLLSNLETNATITNIAKDTATVVANHLIPINNYLEKNQSTFSQNVGSYFGAGITSKFNFLNTNNKSSIKYFFQATTGLSNTKLNNSFNRTEFSTPDQNDKKPSQYNEDNPSPAFFIIHSYFENNFTGANLILGSQIRGNFNNAPFYTFYIGLSTDLEKFQDILK